MSDAGVVLAAIGSSTLVATAVSALVSWRIASRQQEVEREKLDHEREKLGHEREKYEHAKQQRKRDDARNLCQQVIDELAFMQASIQVLHDNWRFWQDRMDDEETREQARQLYEDINKVNADMPALLSDLFGVSYDGLSDAAWEELRKAVLVAQQVYGHTALGALGGKYPDEAWRAWMLVYGKANMTARRLMSEIG